MKFVMPRDRTIATKMGHTIKFVKGELTHVPSECHDEIIAVGGVPEHEIEEDARGANERPENPLEAKAEAFKVFEAMKLKNDSKEFTAGGLPHPRAILQRLGWAVDAKERDALWAEFVQAEKD